MLCQLAFLEQVISIGRNTRLIYLQNRVRDVGFVLAGCSEMFLYENEQEKGVMVRSWLDSNEQKEEGVLAKMCRDGSMRESNMMSLFGWNTVERLAVLARKDVRERCDTAPRPSCHQAAAVS